MLKNLAMLSIILFTLFSLVIASRTASAAVKGPGNGTPTPTPTATASPSPTPDPGRMTGGGSVFTTDKDRVTHGFELHCDASDLPNNLEVNWEGNSFHLEELTFARCNVGFFPAPTAGVHSITGTGNGRYNGQDGAAIKFLFTDAGEPGKNDLARMVILDQSAAVVLQVSGNLDKGNQQFHAH